MRDTCVPPQRSHANHFPDLGTILPDGVDRSNPRVRALLGTPFMQRALTRPVPTDAELETLQRGRRRPEAKSAPKPQPPVDPSASTRPKRAYGPRRHKDRWRDMRTKLPKWLFSRKVDADCRLTDAVAAVLYTIARELRQNPTVSIALDAVAAYAGTSQKTVVRAIQILEDLGLIAILRGAWSRRWHRKEMNRYCLRSERLRAWVKGWFRETLLPQGQQGTGLYMKINEIGFRPNLPDSPAEARLLHSRYGARSSGTSRGQAEASDMMACDRV